jgi:hypothetical protein
VRNSLYGHSEEVHSGLRGSSGAQGRGSNGGGG